MIHIAYSKHFPWINRHVWTTHTHTSCTDDAVLARELGLQQQCESSKLISIYSVGLLIELPVQPNKFVHHWGS